MDMADSEAVASAIERGAASVVGTPLSKHYDQLCEIRQFVVTKDGLTTSYASKVSSASTDLEFPELLSMADTVEDDLFCLDDLELGAFNCPAVAADPLDDTLLDMTGEFLECNSSDSSCVEVRPGFVPLGPSVS